MAVCLIKKKLIRKFKSGQEHNLTLQKKFLEIQLNIPLSFRYTSQIIFLKEQFFSILLIALLNTNENYMLL